MTLYSFLDGARLCLNVRRTYLSRRHPFEACIENVFLMDGDSGICFKGYGQTYEDAVRAYVKKIEGKELKHYASEHLVRSVQIPNVLTV